jgi:hypothetical protein
VPKLLVTYGIEGVLERPLDTYHLGSHNLKVMALGSCVKWALEASAPPVDDFP